MKSARVSRRSIFHAALATAALSSGAWSVASALLPEAARSRALARRVRAVFAVPSSAEYLGRRYLEQNAAEGSIDRLLCLIAKGRGEVERLQALDPLTLSRELGRLIRADFAQDATIRLDGWVLSVTEARLLALAALSAPRIGIA